MRLYFWQLEAMMYTNNSMIGNIKKMENLYSKKISTALDILDDEVRGDVVSAFKKMGPKYSMTWIYKSPGHGIIFPRTKFNSKNLKKEMGKVYKIQGRKYDIKNITENKTVVMIELIESYFDPKIKKVFRTPLVLVLEFKNGKIKRGRHYCDPNISYLHLSNKKISDIYK